MGAFAYFDPLLGRLSLLMNLSDMRGEWTDYLEVYTLFPRALESYHVDHPYPHPRSCEAIQIGEVRSKYGVLGSWTTIFHDPHDPVGALPAPIISSVLH
jgi:hypothetical protein